MHGAIRDYIANRRIAQELTENHLAYKNCTHPRMIIGWRRRECNDIIKDADRL